MMAWPEIGIGRRFTCPAHANLKGLGVSGAAATGATTAGLAVVACVPSLLTPVRVDS